MRTAGPSPLRLCSRAQRVAHNTSMCLHHFFPLSAFQLSTRIPFHPSPAMLARASMSVSRLSAVPAPRLAVAAAAFSSPAEDAAKKMTFGVKSAKATGAAKENNVKHFKIYRWNPDTKGATNAVDRRQAGRGRADGADPNDGGQRNGRR